MRTHVHIGLIATLDTKTEPALLLRGQLEAAGAEVTLLDIGREPQGIAGAVSLYDGNVPMSPAGRSTFVDHATATLRAWLQHNTAHLDLSGVIGIGGSSGTALICRGLQALPLGFPKLIVTTIAASDTRALLESSDIVLVPSIVDVAGRNRILESVFRRAAAMVVSAATVHAFPSKPQAAVTVGMTMFGVTTTAVDRIRVSLPMPNECVVFHATGAGGRAFEELASKREFDLVIDITTTELADELVGGIFSAGPTRLTGAGRAGVYQIVSLGALDMVNFGAFASVPDRYRHRNLIAHNQAVTLMRTSATECALIGRTMADRLNQAVGDVTVLFPTDGFSELSRPDGPFYDPVADETLADALISNLKSGVDVHVVAGNINDPAFTDATVAAARRLPQRDRGH